MSSHPMSNEYEKVLMTEQDRLNADNAQLQARIKELEEAIKTHMESEQSNQADRKLYRMLKNEQIDDPNAHLHARIKELEEAQRWRKWPKEKPEVEGTYLVLCEFSVDGRKFYRPKADKVVFYEDGPVWDFHHENIRFFKPVGDFPKECE